jgi:hypothetical protein
LNTSRCAERGVRQGCGFQSLLVRKGVEKEKGRTLYGG